MTSDEGMIFTEYGAEVKSVARLPQIRRRYMAWVYGRDLGNRPTSPVLTPEEAWHEIANDLRANWPTLYKLWIKAGATLRVLEAYEETKYDD